MSIRRNIVLKYGEETGISAEVNGLCVHSPHATAATNALAHESDIAKVQEWLGTRIFPPHGFTTVAEAGRKIARRFPREILTASLVVPPHCLLANISGALAQRGCHERRLDKLAG